MSKPSIGIFILAFLCCFLSQQRVAAQWRIVGGSTTQINQAPFAVYLRLRGRFTCGGAMISRRHVLTAAHCVQGKNVNSMVVVAGVSDLRENGIRRRVARAFIPSNFRYSTKHRDVAVLRLQRPINSGSVRTIGLCNSRLRVGNRLRIYGWGITNENSRSNSNSLRTAVVPIRNRQRCARQYRNRVTLTSSMICASVPGRTDSCSGDSGGPAVLNGRVCGIVSFGIGCARRNYPGVYTSVPQLRTFINWAMRQ